MSWVNTVLGAAQHQGVPPETVLAAAGIAPQELQAQRWPIDHIARLWRAAVQCTADPGFGLKVGAVVGPASFNVVSFLLQSAPTLRASIALVQQYQRLISDGGRFQTLAAEAASWVVYHPRQGTLAFSPHQIEAVLAAVAAFSRWVTARPVRPLRVQFSHAQLGPLAGYHAIFQCPVEFEQAFSGVLLDNAELDAALPQADAQLARLHHQYAQARMQALAAPSDPADWTQALRQWIHTQLPGTSPSRAQAARALGLTERTLARRLQQSGTHYRALLEAERCRLAQDALMDTRRSLADLAQALGFAEASVFLRAFKRWTGMTPGQWQQANARHLL